jgi:hypothetical protein
MWFDTVRHADSLELLSLHPHEQLEASNTFHGFAILGSVRLADECTKTRLIADLVEGLLEPVTAASCFIPRHGVRASRQGRTVELVICFECNQARVYVERHQDWTTIGRKPKDVIIETLSEAGIPVSPDPSTPNIQVPFQYCAHCGYRVSPYQPRSWADNPQGDDDMFATTQSRATRWPTDYWCERCQTVWQAIDVMQTGLDRECGHFMPCDVRFCAICGR